MRDGGDAGRQAGTARAARLGIRAFAGARCLAPLACVASLALALTGCASPGRAPSSHAIYTEPIRDITLHGDRLGYGGFEIGMAFHEAEAVAGKRFTPLSLDPRDGLCGWPAVDLSSHRQPLQLEFDGTSGADARLKAIWLLLPDRSGNANAPQIAAALKARFPGLAYVPDRQMPEPESGNPRPLYRAASGAYFLVDARLGLYFGALCVAPTPPTPPTPPAAPPPGRSQTIRR